MKLLYTQSNPMLVANAYNLLLAADFKVQLRNRYAGGAAGDLSPFDTWQEVWIDEQQYAQAEQWLEQQLSQETPEDWRCEHCGETNPGSFGQCWNCQHPA